MPAIAAILLVLVTALAWTPSAGAAFTTGSCLGDGVVGRGASDARDAHNSWILNFEDAFCESGAPGVVYEPLESAAGRAALTARLPTGPRFAVTDVPPSLAQTAAIEAGTAATGDDGELQVVPAAIEAIAPLVNFPDGCDAALLTDAHSTAEQDLDADATPDDVVRAIFLKSQWEKLWAKDPAHDRWTELFPELATDVDCDKPIIRVVRFDSSGTTVTVKGHLAAITPTRDWLTTYATDDALYRDRVWPRAVVGPRTDCAGAVGPGSQGDAADQLTSACSAGNGPLVEKLIATDGSVGYADLSTARTVGLAITPEADDNDTYWTQMKNGSNLYAEPTAGANGFRSGGTKGANCADITFAEVPASTTGDWTGVTAVNSPEGYGICSLTYGLVFEDHADVWGATPAEERKARTVKDYWESVLSDQGQSLLFPNDYAPLPAGMLATARAGVEAIDWSKDATEDPPEGDPPGNDPPAPPEGGDPAAADPPAKRAARPSNLFSVPRVAVNSPKGRIAFSIRVPGAGSIEVAGRARLKRSGSAPVGRARRTVSRAGTYKATVELTRAAKRALRKRLKLNVKVTVVYKPRAGDARRSSRTLSLKLDPPKRQRR